MVVLVTGAGAPGFIGTYESLVNNYDNRKIKIIGVDCKDDVIGKYYCDKFYQIPKATDPHYLDALSIIYKVEHVDVILPQNTAELEILAKSDLNVAVSKRVGVVNNKANLIELCQNIRVPIPKYFTANTKDELYEAVYRLGYPDKKVVVKPPSSNGSRGVRIIDDTVDFKKIFYEEKIGLYTPLKHLTEILGEEFPKLLVTEYLEGDEYTIDCFRGNRFVAIPRLREEVKNGITFKSKIVKDDSLIEYSRRIASALDLKYAFGFQFKGGKILESNPRIQGTMIASTYAGANIIYSAVKYALGEDVPEFNINWNSKLIRYWGSKGI